MGGDRFRHRLADEWRRLTPATLSSEASMNETFCESLRHGAATYFAPLRLLWWIFVRSWR